VYLLFLLWVTFVKRTIVEVLLALGLIGAGVFGWMNWKQVQTVKSQAVELKAASEEAAKLAATSQGAIAAAEQQSAALKAQLAPLQAKVNQLEAIKAAMASGTTLADLEAAYKSQKSLSAERQVGLGALRMLTKGGDDPAALEAFRTALKLTDLGNRKNTMCAAQIALAAAGDKVAVMSECQPEGAHGGADTPAKSDTQGQAPAHGSDSTVKAKDAAVHTAPHWGYAGEMGPDRWGKEFPTCAKGKSQSPLDIVGPFVKARTSVSADYKEGPLKIVNNGHTIQVNVPPGSKLRIDAKPYELLQFHFHRPSEERVEGKPMSMVVHFVHKGSDGKLVVLGVLLKEGNENPGIKALWANMPRKEGPEVIPEGVKFNPGSLLPREFDFFSYEGSLTTPPCTEGVRFFILKSTVNVSAAQVAEFPFDANARPVQSRNGREIITN
jgi:carbonic anhydrase